MGREVDSERIGKQFDFIREIDKEKFIGRQTYLSDGERKRKRCRARMAYGNYDDSAK